MRLYRSMETVNPGATPTGRRDVVVMSSECPKPTATDVLENSATSLPSPAVATSNRGRKAGLGWMPTMDFSSIVSTQTASNMVSSSFRLCAKKC